MNQLSNHWLILSIHSDIILFPHVPKELPKKLKKYGGGVGGIYQFTTRNEWKIHAKQFNSLNI